MSGITFIVYAQCQNIQMTNNSKVFGINKAKWLKQDSLNQPWLPMTEEGESQF